MGSFAFCSLRCQLLLTKQGYFLTTYKQYCRQLQLQNFFLCEDLCFTIRVRSYYIGNFLQNIFSFYSETTQCFPMIYHLFLNSFGEVVKKPKSFIGNQPVKFNMITIVFGSAKNFSQRIGVLLCWQVTNSLAKRSHSEFVQCHGEVPKFHYTL